MNTDQQIVEYLADKDNIEFAWDVYEHLPDVKEHLQKRFWHDAEKRLRSFVSQEPSVDARWRVDSGISRHYARSAGLQLVPKSGGSRYLAYALEQFRLDDSYPEIYIGYFWNDLATTVPPVAKPAVDRLNAAADERKLDGEHDDGWLRWANTRWEARRKEFCIQMARDPEVILRDTVDALWDLFEATHQTVEELNKLLAEEARS